MEVTRGNCPHCKRKLFNYNPGSWRYESPIRICIKCKKKYVDTRYHEIVIDGIRPDALREKSDQRLQDKNYAQELLLVGYDVPEKYL